MTINMNVIQDLVRLHVAFALGAQYGHLVSTFAQRPSLLPHTGVKGNGLVLDDDEDLLNRYHLLGFIEL